MDKCSCRQEYADVIHSDVLPNHCPPTKRKAQFTKPVTTCCRRRHKDILPSAHCSRCRRLDSTMRAVLLSQVLFPHLGFTSAGVAPLTPRFHKLLDETVKTFAVCHSCLLLLGCDDNCILSFSIKHERPSLQQMANWRNLPGVVPVGPSRCFATCSWYQGRFLSLPLSLVCCCLAHAFVCSMSPAFSA